MRLPIVINALFQSAYRVVNRDAVVREEGRAQAWFVLVHCSVGITLALAAVVFLTLLPSEPALAGILLMMGCAALALSLFLIRSGALFILRCASIVAFAMLVAWMCIRSDGLNGPVLILLALAPLEAARLQDRTLVNLSLVSAGLVFVFLVAIDGVPTFSTALLVTCGALAYAAAVALNATASVGQPILRDGAISTSQDDDTHRRARSAIPVPRIPAMSRRKPAVTPRPAMPVETRVSNATFYGNSSVSSQFCVQEGDCRVR